MQAILPEILREREIKDMIDGESAYVVPWAMSADQNGALWLKSSYTLRDKTGGTVQMKVTKNEGEYICDVSLCKDHGWSRVEGNYADGGNYLAVAQLNGI